MRRVTTAIALFLFTFCVNTSAQSFRYDDFSDILTLSHNNTLARGGTLELTPAIPTPGAGAVWYNQRLPLGRAWSTTLTFQITDTAGDPDAHGHDGGDGLALVIQTVGAREIGKSGYGIGYDGIPNGIAIEIDTWDDTEEPSWQGATEDSSAHIAIHSNGREILSAVPVHSNIALSRRLSIDVSDGLPHLLAVRYSPGNLAVYLDDCSTPVLELAIWLDVLLDMSDGAYIGVTAATQRAWERHTLLSWCFTMGGPGCGCPAPCDTLVVRDTLRLVDTLTVRDTVTREVLVEVRDTMIIRDTTTNVLVDTLVVHWVDTLYLPQTDTLILRDTVAFVVRDTVIIGDSLGLRVDTVFVVRDTCAGRIDSTIIIGDSVCGYQTRAFEWQSPVSLELHPNPVSGHYHLTAGIMAPGAWTLRVYDMWGVRRVEREGNGSATLELDVRGLDSGSYLAILASGDERRVVPFKVQR